VSKRAQLACDFSLVANDGDVLWSCGIFQLPVLQLRLAYGYRQGVVPTAHCSVFDDARVAPNAWPQVCALSPGPLAM
jgi:hypothetical protein